MAVALTTRRRHPRFDRRLTIGLGGPAAAFAVAAATQLTGPTLCPTRLCTGHACPGCGLTRAVGAAIRGDVTLSMRFHPLALLIIAQLVAAWGLAATGRWSPAWQRRLPALVIVNTLALVAVWIVRWRLGLLEFVLQG